MSKLMTRLGLVALFAGLVLVRGPGEADLAAQEKGKADLPPDLARISGRTHAIISIRPADVWDTDLGKGIRTKVGKDITHVTRAMEEAIGLEPASIERLTLVMPMVAPGVEPVVYVASKQALEKKFLEKVVPGGAAKKHADVEYFGNDHKAVWMLDDKHYVLGSVADVQTAIDNGKAKPEGNLVPALRLAAGKNAVVVAANPEGIGTTINVPPQAEEFKPLFAATLATLTLDVGEKTRGQLRVTYPKATDAKEGAKAIEAGRTMLLGSMDVTLKVWEKNKTAPGVVGLLRGLESAIKAAKLTQTGTTLAANVEMNTGKDAGAAVAEAVVKVREAATRTRSMNNLKQIALAMHNYQAVFNNFPPAATYDKNGKPLLSWRVLILPYIEQDALYKEFKLDEPWDSPHNKKLIEKMPKVYEVPESKPQYKHGTFYQVFHGKGAGFEGKRGLGFAEFTDGTSNTILVVESGKDVPWTKPEDVEFDAGKDVPKLGGNFANGFHAAFADGSVRFLQTGINKDTLKALITRNGGEVVGGF